MGTQNANCSLAATKSPRLCNVVPSWHLAPSLPRARRQAAREKFKEAYKWLQRALDAARSKPDAFQVQPICVAADWVHFKRLLYAIGSGHVTGDNMSALHEQWASHARAFFPPLGAQRTLRCQSFE